jgi:hypothetical protein
MKHSSLASLVSLVVACGCAGGVFSTDGATDASAARGGAGPIKVFILAGQSNMVGPGSAKHIREHHPELVAPRADVRCAWAGMKTGPLAPRYGFRSDSFGPELLFGHVLGDALEEPVLLVKSGVGGTTLFKDWRPPSTVARAGGEVGPLYADMMRFFRAVLDNLDDQCPEWSGRGFEIAGFVWFQGENDTCGKADKSDPASGYWNFYEENLRDLIADVRAGVGVADLPILIIQINDSGCWEAQRFQVNGETVRVPSGPVVRAAQRKVAETTPGCAWIETLDLNDGYHYDSPSHVVIGRRAGKAMLPLLLGRCADHSRDPRVLAARALSREEAGSRATGLPAPDTASLRRGLIAYLPFDEGEGSETTGLGPKRLRGELKGAGWQDGLIGGAVRLEGDASIEVPNFREPVGAGGTIEALSVSFWLQTPCRSPHQRVGRGAGRQYAKLDNSNWAISQRANVAGWDVTNHDIDGFFFFTAAFGDGPREAHAGWRDPHSHTDGYAWRHVAAVYDGRARRFELYVDGKRTEASPKSLGETHITPADTPLTIGGPMTVVGHHAYDELAIWSRALKADEIAKLYNGGRGVRIP